MPVALLSQLGVLAWPNIPYALLGLVVGMAIAGQGKRLIFLAAYALIQSTLGSIDAFLVPMWVQKTDGIAAGLLSILTQFAPALLLWCAWRIRHWRRHGRPSQHD